MEPERKSRKKQSSTSNLLRRPTTHLLRCKPIFVAVLHGVDRVAAVDCSSLTSCEACYNASSWCHWCAGSSSAETETEAGKNRTTTPNPFHSQQSQDIEVVLGGGSGARQHPPFSAEAGGSCHNRGAGCLAGASCGDDNTNSTCAAQVDCQSCQAASSLCHWCGAGYGGCHVLGSYYGCTVGVSCMANTECERKQPEFIGYGSAPDWLYVAVGGGLAIFLTLVACVQCVCYRVYKSVQGAREEIENSYEHPDADPDPAVRRPALWARLVDRLVSGCFKNTCYCCLCFVPLLLVFSLLFVMHFPRQPVIDYCSKELEWGKLITNIETLVTEQLYADFEFLVSVYNPNKVRVTIDEVKGNLYYPPGNYGSGLIGTVSLKNFTAAPGAVSDGLAAVVSLAVERWGALNLAKEYALGNLKIGVRGEVAFELDAYGWSLLPKGMMAAIPDTVIDTAAPIDMTYCNCRNGPPKGGASSGTRTSRTTSRRKINNGDLLTAVRWKRKPEVGANSEEVAGGNLLPEPAGKNDEASREDRDDVFYT